MTKRCSRLGSCKAKIRGPQPLTEFHNPNGPEFKTCASCRRHNAVYYGGRNTGRPGRPPKAGTAELLQGQPPALSGWAREMHNEWLRELAAEVREVSRQC